jgi:hypothetical protein
VLFAALQSPAPNSPMYFRRVKFMRGHSILTSRHA